MAPEGVRGLVCISSRQAGWAKGFRNSEIKIVYEVASTFGTGLVFKTLSVFDEGKSSRSRFAVVP